MSQRSRKRGREFGATFGPVTLVRHLNWPKGRPRGRWWKELAERVGKYPQGRVTAWGIPFHAGKGRVILLTQGPDEIAIGLAGRADFLCLLHEWRQLPQDVHSEQPAEGRVVGEYEIAYADGSGHVQLVRARYEVEMEESPGPCWQAVHFHQGEPIDPANVPPDKEWGWAQHGTTVMTGVPLVYALPNPHPEKTLRSLTVRCLTKSPLLVAALTLYRGSSHPLRHLPRRHYRVTVPGGPVDVQDAEVDLGVVTRLEKTTGPRGKRWLASPYAGLVRPEEPGRSETLSEAVGAEDATLSVKLAGRRGAMEFSLGQAFHGGSAPARAGRGRMEVLAPRRQWMQVVVRDSSTGRPTPVRIHFSGPRGQYIAPHGHHAQINPGWFMDYGADVTVGGRNFAYVDGEFTTEMPVGDVYLEMCKGFEYAPVRRKVTIRPGQKSLELTIDRAADWRKAGWVTADTHVHFISPHTAALQAQGEGVNIVNLLATQLGRLFTNVGDIRGRVAVLEEDTMVYVGTENRHHMLGHMSMLGTKGLPVYPMCCGGPGEAYLGDPDFLAMAEWARENRRKGGVVIRPHFPYCGNTEDPVPILAGLVDALELHNMHEGDYPLQEWYRYLNCGYRVAVAGGTDKMGAYCALGWLRTYALTDPNRALDYDNWSAAVRAGRTFSTNGPLIDIAVDGRQMGEAIDLPASGGTVEVRAHAECVWPLGRIEIVHNGRVVAAERAGAGAKRLRVAAKVPVAGSGWIAARCTGPDKHPGQYLAAHTSPVYLRCGDGRAFNGPAAEHMLSLVEGGIEYLNTLATRFDESSRRRMVKLFNEARRELRGRLLVEGEAGHHSGTGPYHTHGHGNDAGHTHH